MADLGPFRTIVDLSATLEWRLDYRFVRDFALFSGPDKDAVMQRYQEWLARYGSYSPPWIVTYADSGGFATAEAEFRVTRSMRIDEAPGWEPPPLDDIDAYRRYFEALGFVAFAYPEPEEAIGTFSVPGTDIPDQQQFAITAVEKRPA